MLIELSIAIILGLLAGTFTGLIPGIHINLVAISLLAIAPLLLQYTSVFPLATFIVSMAITHTFLDFIPSIFLGAPEESTALGVLPGHRMLMKKRGYEAVKLSIIGSYFGLILMLFVIPIFLIFLSKVYSSIEIGIPYILILASAFLILKEKNKLWAFFIFLFSGVLGILTLNLVIIKQPLFPLLTGLFGISILFNSINQKTKIPKQEITKTEISKKEVSRALGAGIISSPLCSFLPGLGASQAAVIGSQISGKLSERGFLVLLGSISTIVVGLSFIALYTIERARSGTAAAIGQLLIEIQFNQLLALLATMLIAGSVAVFVGIFFAKLFAKNISKVNYPKLCGIIITFLFILSVLLSGPYSIIILITASAIGILTIKKEVRKMNLMGCLILPVILILLL